MKTIPLKTLYKDPDLRAAIIGHMTYSKTRDMHQVMNFRGVRGEHQSGEALVRIIIRKLRANKFI